MSLCLRAESPHPQINGPRLSYLDTNYGLDQDTINDIHVDQEGFVWIATEEGLNRFDGVKVLPVLGKNSVLNANSVFQIFEHSNGLLYLSTVSNGVVSLHKYTHEVKTVMAIASAVNQQWLQYANDILETADGNLLVALNESIYLHNVTTQENTLLFDLSRKDKELGNDIRAVYLFKNLLLVGTETTLIAHDIENNITVDLYATLDFKREQKNVKYLQSFDGKTLLVGSVEGLYHYSLGEIEKVVSDGWLLETPTLINADRNIWDMVKADDDSAYVATDIGVYRLNLQSFSFDYLFQPRKNLEVLSELDIINITLDPHNNVWMGTRTSGAMYWSPSSLLFTNVYNSVFNERQNRLSHNVIRYAHQYDANTVYLATANGLNKYDLETGEINPYVSSEKGSSQYTESDIYKIASVDRNFLWLSTGGGMRKFDVSTHKYVSFENMNERIQNLFNQFVYGFEFVNEYELWLISGDGIYLIDMLSQDVKQIDLGDSGLPLLGVNRFLGFDTRSNSVIISASKSVWAINRDSQVVSKLHGIDENISQWVYSGNWVRAKDNSVWVSYPSHGMYKLDGITFKVLEEYNTNQYLPTNLMYGLMFDGQNNLWFSSNSGIHVLNPSSNQVESLGFVNGLASSEFNLSANITLVDGRMIYGGNLGFTLFDPANLLGMLKNVKSSTTITEIDVSTRDLTLPFNSLNGLSLELAHDDIGLSVYFSSLTFDILARTRYQYRIISGGETISYPSIETNKIFIPMLAPGKHRIEIFQANSTATSGAAILNIKVAYPLYASPLAYFCYFVIICFILSYVYYRQRRVQYIIQDANAQVSVYNKRLKDALVASNANIWEWDSRTDLIRCERIWSDLQINVKYNGDDFKDTMLMSAYIKLVHEADRVQFETQWQEFVQRKIDAFDVTYRVKNKSGKTLYYRDVGSISKVDSTGVLIMGTYTNLTGSLAAQEKLKLFGNAFKHTHDWVLIFNKDKELIAANPSFHRAFARDTSARKSNKRLHHQETLHRAIKQLGTMKAGQQWKTEFSLELSGKQLTLLTDFNAVADKNDASLVDYYLIIATDISEQIKAQKELQKLANYDVLTGLINRTLLLERLKQSIHFAKRHRTQLATLFIDLDGFKPINDSFGHLAGDSVLSEIAGRLRDKFREQDSVARLGGDEFVVVLEEINDAQDVQVIAGEILKLIEQPITIGKQIVSVSGSIGISIYPDDATDAQHLLRNADVAMYAAKKEGKNRYQYFTESMNARVQKNTILQNRIKVAAAQKQFVNYYQAIIDINSGKTVGFEMLLRWFDDGKLVSPAQFIPLAEQIGCIVTMTTDAINNAIDDASHWYNQGFSGYVAINLSAKHFSKRPDYEAILSALNKYKLPTSCLRFEITEGLLVNNDKKTLDYMNEMRALGFKIALDDFGTGYSSLKYINDFPLDMLKIDRSFVQNVVNNKGTESIVQSTLMMTHLLHLDTVAEGIETREQLHYFQNQKCRFGQGFYFTQAIPFEEVGDQLYKNWFESEQ